MPADIIALALGVAFFTWACTRLALSLLSANWRSTDALALAGVVLLVNIPAAWFNFKGVQAKVPMTAAMMAACPAITGSRWRVAGRAPNRPKPAEEAACAPRGSAGRSPRGSRARREEP
ncbi:MAG: hypothetical protein ACXU8R_12360 [Xanthobacteraceae bacterium]